jgi:hypothetical protein
VTELVIDSDRRDLHELGSATSWFADPRERGERLPGTDAGGVSA